MKIKIYFSGLSSVRSDLNSDLVQKLNTQYQLYVPKSRSVKMNANQFHNQEIEALEVADLFISVIKAPSLAAGYEMCLAEQLDLPNLILYPDRFKIGDLIRGSTKLNLVSYQNPDQIEDLISKKLKAFER